MQKRAWYLVAVVIVAVAWLGPHPSFGSAGDDQQIVADLDSQYQEAVKSNNAAAMDRLLADDFMLVVGSGATHNKADLLAEARSGKIVYEHQEDSHRSVRVWGNTAVVTAMLWEKGVENNKPFDEKLWFSDVYARTKAGWRYVFGQASTPLKDAH
jgi:hypothetical protein